MITDITCQKADMLLINYEAPTGEKRHQRLWNGGNVGCEYGEFDHPDAYQKHTH